MNRRWAILFAVTAICLFCSAMTFSSMGIVVYAMASDFGWSEAQAGSTFTSLTAVCALTSLLPIVLIPRIGARATFVAGSLILAGGFALAWAATSLAGMLVAAALFGPSFSLVANAPGIYLIATWFGDGSSRIIAVYLMLTNLGGVLGPLLAAELVAGEGGWRLHWLSMAAVAIVLAIVCAVLIRERPDQILTAAVERESASNADPDSGWALRSTVRHRQFWLLAAAMVITQACVITVSSVIASHFEHVGQTAAFAATMLSAQALIGTIATGLAGPLSERVNPRLLLAGSLFIEAIGVALLAMPQDGWTAWLFALAFGIGWAVATFAITVLLIRYFGNKGGSAALSAVWMLCGLAAAGPPIAGQVADTTGSFVPAILGLAILLLPLALAACWLRQPGQPRPT
ncbi:MFS transporter [soil metagenome]